jgi:hypothetical protein
MDMKNEKVITMKKRKYKTEGVPYNTRVRITGLKDKFPMLEILDENGGFVSGPYPVTHPDLGIMLTEDHTMTLDEDHREHRLINGSTEGCLLTFGEPSLFRVYDRKDFTDYVADTLMARITDSTCVMVTNEETGSKSIDVDMDF